MIYTRCNIIIRNKVKLKRITRLKPIDLWRDGQRGRGRGREGEGEGGIGLVREIRRGREG